MLQVPIEFTLNGRATSVTVPPDMSVLTMLREKLDLMGAKLVCGEGECGACTVLVDDDTINSCLMFAVDCDGRTIETLEGLRDGEELDPMQRAFVEHGAIQCGFCMPGMIMRTVAFLDHTKDPTDSQIARSIEGNLCRCTGYVKIHEAIRNAATALADATSAEVVA